MASSISKAVKQIKSLLEEYIEDYIKEEGEDYVEDKVLDVVNEAMPKMIDSLDAATGGLSLVAIEVIDFGKIGVHATALWGYYASGDYVNVGWELGAITYDIIEAAEGQTSVTVGDHTYDLISVEGQNTQTT